jgi:hypothetical protein
LHPHASAALTLKLRVSLENDDRKKWRTKTKKPRVITLD